MKQSSCAYGARMNTLAIILVLAFTLKDVQAGKGCSFFHYYSQKANECVQCPKCGSGMGLERNCGHDEEGNMRPGKSRCRKCSGREHRKEYPMNYFCEICKTGDYYDEEDRRCRKCSSCRDDSKKKNISKCIEDGMIASCSCSEKEGYPAEDECQNKDPTPTKIFLTTHHLPTTESSSKSSRRSTTTHHLPTTESSSKSSRRSTTIAKSSSPPRRTYKMSTVKLSSSVITTKSIKPTTITPKAIKSREKSSALLLKEATTHKHHTSNRPRQTTKLITPTTTSSNTHSLPDNYTGISVYSRSYIMRRDASLKRPTRIIDTIKGTLPEKSKTRNFWMIVALVGVVLVIAVVVVATKFFKNEKHQPRKFRMNHEGQESTSISVSGSMEVLEEKEEKEEKKKEELETAYSTDIGPATDKGLVAVPFTPNKDVCLYVHDLQPQPDLRNSGQHDHPYKERLLDKGSLFIESFSANDPDEQSVSERWINLESDESQIRLLPCGGMSFSSCGRPSFQLDRRLYKLGECEKRTLKEKLDLEATGINNWKEVAAYFKVPQDTITMWKTKIKADVSPTEALLHYLGTQNKTVADLLNCLRTLERLDAEEVLTRHLRLKCCICR